MRYRDLIIVLFFIATASFLWAEPTREVRVPTQQDRLSEGWSIPDLNEPAPQELREPVKPPRKPLREPVSLNDFSNEDFQLNLTVVSGSDLKNSTFEVAFLGPKGFDLARVAGSDVRFIATLDNGWDGVLPAEKLVKVGKNRWQVKGVDLVESMRRFGDEPIEGERTVRFSTFLMDQEQSRFSRGARIVTVESEPVRLTFR